VQKFDALLEERVVVEDAGGWWLFFLTGIAWLVFALLVFQWDYTTVYAISFLFRVVAVIAGVNDARGDEHHRGDDVGALRSGVAVEEA
jgi:uncharacterized membrane protein HdeD (DUF308 family)